MRIEINPDVERKDVYILIVDGQFWRHFHKSLFGTRPKFISSTFEQLKEEFLEKERRFAKTFALKRLAMKAYHSMELIDLLLEKLVNSEVIEEVICECFNLGYLNDDDHLKRLVHSEKSRRAGPRKIIWKVRRKGIVDPEVEKLVEREYPIEEQVSQMRRLLETRYRDRDLKCPKERGKLFAAFSRKGFDFEAIQMCLSSV